MPEQSQRPHVSFLKQQDVQIGRSIVCRSITQERTMAVAAKKASIVDTAETMRDDAVNYVKATANSAEHNAAALQNRVVRDVTDMADTVSGKLKAVAIDTDVMADLAKGEASELQRLVTEQLKNHPARTLGLVAALGVFVGLMTKR
jgi:ElaB/YqjD/DUF883 family membrane-anchored ribosome-binding protein